MNQLIELAELLRQYNQIDQQKAQLALFAKEAL